MELRTLHMEDAQSMMEVIREAFAAAYMQLAGTLY